jgi:predicted nucleic acid-binding protein
VLLIDNSAWARLSSPRLDLNRAETVAEWLTEQRLATCLPFLLEAGYCARSGAERDAMIADLQRLTRVPIDADVEQAAMKAQRSLAQVGHHRLPPTDIIIAACAHTAGMGVLHYDGDFDQIATHTDLVFESAWLAPAGSL